MNCLGPGRVYHTQIAAVLGHVPSTFLRADTTGNTCPTRCCSESFFKALVFARCNAAAAAAPAVPVVPSAAAAAAALLSVASRSSSSSPAPAAARRPTRMSGDCDHNNQRKQARAAPTMETSAVGQNRTIVLKLLVVGEAILCCFADIASCYLQDQQRVLERFFQGSHRVHPALPAVPRRRTTSASASGSGGRGGGGEGGEGLQGMAENVLHQPRGGGDLLLLREGVHEERVQPDRSRRGRGRGGVWLSEATTW